MAARFVLRFQFGSAICPIAQHDCYHSDFAFFHFSPPRGPEPEAGVFPHRCASWWGAAAGCFMSSSKGESRQGWSLLTPSVNLTREPHRVPSQRSRPRRFFLFAPPRGRPFDNLYQTCCGRLVVGAIRQRLGDNRPRQCTRPRGIFSLSPALRDELLDTPKWYPVMCVCVCVHVRTVRCLG